VVVAQIRWIAWSMSILWVPNGSSTAVTCGIAGGWSSGMIADRDGTTSLSDLPAAHGLARIAGP
jgi:hypothetical protein